MTDFGLELHGHKEAPASFGPTFSRIVLGDERMWLPIETTQRALLRLASIGSMPTEVDTFIAKAVSSKHCSLIRTTSMSTWQSPDQTGRRFVPTCDHLGATVHK